MTRITSSSQSCLADPHLIKLPTMPNGEHNSHPSSHTSPPPPPPPPPTPAADTPLSPTHPLHPLLSFYQHLHRTPPSLRFLSPTSLPQPYRQLLHHRANMTPTLSAHHRSPLRLHVLHQTASGQRCTRYVRLLTEAGQCVELGCIAIELDALPGGGVRCDVLAGVRPFGSVLLEAGVRQLCEPCGFFEVDEDDVIRQAMGVEAEVGVGDKCGRVLYGRCNVISDECGRVIARVVEILPTIDPSRCTVSCDDAETS